MHGFSIRFLIGAGIALLLGQQALAQKVSQPWTAPRGAHQSRVISCTNPNPPAGASVAMDDWICPASGAMTRVQWWGIVRSTAQLTRRYYVAVWSHSAAGACRPATRLYQACVVPSTIAVGTDCRQRIVYRFSASLPAPYFVQTAGTHYWLQISEDDSGSVTVGVDDFLWSSHLPISPAPLCPALRQTAGGVIVQPIFDDCPAPIPTDLAFRFFGTTIVGIIPFPVTVSPSVFLLQLQDDAGAVLETIPVEPSDDGSFEVEPSLGPGMYRAEMIGMGLAGMRGMLSLDADAENMLMLSSPCLADFNQDGRANSQDYFDFLRVFFAGCQ